MGNILNTHKVVVTGGLGFIGSNLVDALVDKGYDVHVIDNNTSHAYYNQKAVYYNYDISKPIDVASKIFNNAVAVFHLAAEIYVQKSLEFPNLFKDVNQKGTENIVKYAKEANVHNFIFSSTSAIYGNTYYGRGSLETDKPDCLNAYSESKYAAELICETYSKKYKMNIAVLRYFNVYGNRQHQSGQYAPVIGAFLRQKSMSSPLTVVGDGSQRRDFVNVEDVVKANYLAFKSNIGFNVYNIGFGSNISIIDLAKEVSDNIVHIPPRDAECKETLADITKAKNMLSWEPKISIEEYISERTQ